MCVFYFQVTADAWNKSLAWVDMDIDAHTWRFSPRIHFLILTTLDSSMLCVLRIPVWDPCCQDTLGVGRLFQYREVCTYWLAAQDLSVECLLFARLNSTPPKLGWNWPSRWKFARTAHSQFSSMIAQVLFLLERWQHLCFAFFFQIRRLHCFFGSLGNKGSKFYLEKSRKGVILV